MICKHFTVKMSITKGRNINYFSYNYCSTNFLLHRHVSLIEIPLYFIQFLIDYCACFKNELKGKLTKSNTLLKYISWMLNF